MQERAGSWILAEFDLFDDHARRVVRELMALLPDVVRRRGGRLEHLGDEARDRERQAAENERSAQACVRVGERRETRDIPTPLGPRDARPDAPHGKKARSSDPRSSMNSS
jgi:hypothetical protein